MHSRLPEVPDSVALPGGAGRLSVVGCWLLAATAGEPRAFGSGLGRDLLLAAAGKIAATVGSHNSRGARALLPTTDYQQPTTGTGARACQEA